jgi:hypothetical protein
VTHGPAGPQGDDPEPDPVGSLRPITPRALALTAVVGLVTGWAFPRVALRWFDRPPMVSWAQPLTLFLAAAILSFLAWHTWRTVHQLGERLEPQRAVNRLVLARAGALMGAAVAGGYAGYAISWLGDASQRADDWILRSALACLAALVVMLASVALERACRAPGDGLQL